MFPILDRGLRLVLSCNVQAEVGEARVGVFFCGNPTAKHALAKLCAQANETGSTKFIFHAEHF